VARRTARQARTLGLWTAAWLFVLLLAGLLRLGDLSVQWPVLAVPVLWALVALRPRRGDAVRRPEPDRPAPVRRPEAVRRPEPDRRYPDDRYPQDDARGRPEPGRPLPTPPGRPAPRELPPTRELPAWGELPPLREAPRRRGDRREG